jgi:hypothetical protein
MIENKVWVITRQYLDGSGYEVMDLGYSNGVSLSISTRKTMPTIGNGNGNVQKTEDQL